VLRTPCKRLGEVRKRRLVAKGGVEAAHAILLHTL
jgi:hypothetical protein